MNFMKRVLFLFLFILSFSSLFSQEDLSQSNWKMTQAKLLYEDNKPGDALVIYLEILGDYSADAFLNFRIGECYYKTRNFTDALKYLKIAKSNCKDKAQLQEILFQEACTFHKLNQFDEAIVSLSSIVGGTATIDSTQINQFISQVKLAKSAFNNAGDYLIPFEDDNINSPSDEIYPVYSRGEDKLYFTSNRKVKENQEKNLVSNNYQYSVFESATLEPGVFAVPELVDESFATDKNFILGSVSAGDATYYLHKNSPEIKDGGDLYFDTKDTDEDFTDSEKIPGLLNTEYYENSPSFDFINEKFYFVSNRKFKVKDNSEIFVSRYFKQAFAEAEMYYKISGDFDEGFVYVHPGGDFMVISSNCDKSIGGYDLFILFNNNGKWTEPVNMGYPINSCSDENQFGLSSDGETAFISSDRPGGKGGFDIYVMDLGSYFTENCGFIPALVFISGQVTDEDASGIETEIKFVDISDSKNSQQIKSDADGYFNCMLKAGKKYNLSVKQKSFAEYAEELDLMLMQGGKIEKEIELVAKP